VKTEEQIGAFRQTYAALRSEISKTIVGHDAIVDGTLIALLAGGHVLLEGVPGLGKTLLVRTLSEATIASGDRSAGLQLRLIVGGMAGLLLGVALATVLVRRSGDRGPS
jgi:ATP-dependent 26S proteasome regulatory subunit